jgi:hypothetical protein
MIEWEYEFSYGKKEVRLDTEQVVSHIINDNDERGELEDLRAKIDKLTEFVSNIVSYLPDEAQEKIVRDVSWCWKPLKEL